MKFTMTIVFLTLEIIIKELKKDERKLLYLRYFADKTQTEIGEELGISQVQVSRMEKKDPENHAGTRKRIKGCMFSGKTGILFPI